MGRPSSRHKRPRIEEPGTAGKRFAPRSHRFPHFLQALDRHGGRRAQLLGEELHAQFTQLLSGIDPKNVVVYCGSGVTSCFHLLAMEIAGLPGARLYPGSWSEWIRDPNHPIAHG